jgi:hypothetical protein
VLVGLPVELMVTMVRWLGPVVRMVLVVRQ